MNRDRARSSVIGDSRISSEVPITGASKDRLSLPSILLKKDDIFKN